MKWILIRYCQCAYLQLHRLRIHCAHGDWCRLLLPGKLHCISAAGTNDRVDQCHWLDEYLYANCPFFRALKLETHTYVFLFLAQFLGILFFLAIMGTSYQNLVIEKIHSILPNASDTDVRQFIAGTSSSLSASLTSAQSADVLNAIVTAMRSVWILLAVAGGICVILSLFLGV